MLKYLAYCRKSSEDKDRQIISIDSQRSELGRKADAEGITVVDVLEESMSAKAPGRPMFGDMLERIGRGEANAILTWKLDRLARNFDDGGRIIGLLQRGVIQEIRTFERTYLPTDNVLMIAVELGMANQYVRDLSVNVKRGLREKLRRGEYPSKAPLGYFTEPKLLTKEPHPQKFGRLKRILERFAAGTHTLSTINQEMIEAGLIGERSNQPLRLSSVRRILSNPFYYGVFRYKGELHQGVHAPMITKATFDRIHAALIARGRPRLKQRDKGLPFMKFAVCGSCGLSVTGERHVKKSGLIFRYYRCTHKIKGCLNRRYVSHSAFAAEIKRNTELAILSDEWAERFLAQVEAWEQKEVAAGEARRRRLQAELASVNYRITRLNNAFADESLAFEEFREMKNPLVPRKVELEAKIASLVTRKTNRLEPLRSWIREANSLKTSISDDDLSAMKEFLMRHGSNRVLHDHRLTVSFEKPWQSLVETNSAVRGNTIVGDTCSAMRTVLDEARTYFDENPG